MESDSPLFHKFPQQAQPRVPVVRGLNIAEAIYMATQQWLLQAPYA